jgi:hypothetical protein
MERSLKFALFAAVVLIPLIASAHERQAFRIGDRTYTFVVGFLNEPVFVDDKSGVDLRVRLGDAKNPKPVERLEKSLKVEVSAGDRKQVFDLEPAFREPGAYRATFFPTVATVYRFRVFGELNETPVDLTFTCNAAGHPRTAEDKSEVKLSNRVTRVFQAGSFGCPQGKDAVEFP